MPKLWEHQACQFLKSSQSICKTLSALPIKISRQILLSQELHSLKKKANMISHFVTINHLLCKLRYLQDFRESRPDCTRGLYKQWKIYNVSNTCFQEGINYKSKCKRIWTKKEKRASVDHKRETERTENTPGKTVLWNTFIWKIYFQLFCLKLVLTF